MFGSSIERSRAGQPTLHSSQSQKLANSDFPFFLLLLLLFFDYGRPQNWLPALGSLHIPMFIQILLFLCLVAQGKLFNFRNIQSKCFVGLVILMAFHVPIAVNNYHAYQTTRIMALYLIIFLSIVNFVDSFRKIRMFFIVWIIVNVMCALIAEIQGKSDLGSGFLGDENDLALVMNMTIPFAYFMFFQVDSFGKKILYLSAVGLFIAANVASLSRGGFVGLIPVIAYCWYRTPKKVLATVAIVIMLGILSFFATERYWDEMRSIKEENTEQGTGGERWYSWKIGWRMFLDHPIIGVGGGNYAWNVAPYEPAEGYRGRSRAGRAAHSLYFTLIPELGLIGIFLFGGMLYYTRKDKKWVLNLEETLIPLRTTRKHEDMDQADRIGVDMGICLPCSRKKLFSGEKLETLLTKNPEGRIQVSFAHELHKLKFIIFGINGALLGYLVSGIFLSVLYYPHFWLLITISVAIKNVVQVEVEKLQNQIV